MSAGSAAQRGGSAADAVGVVVLGACATWSLVTAAATGGRPEGDLLAVLAVAAGYAGGRISGALLPVGAPAVGALAGTVLAVAAPYRAPLSDGPPLPDDAAGSAAVLALSVAVACCAARAAGRPAVRAALWLLAGAVVVTAALLGPPAGAVAACVVLACAPMAGRLGRVRGLVGLAVAAALAAVGAWAVAARAVPGGGPGSAVNDTLLTYRVRLWHDAVGLAVDHWALGAGPGRFGELSPTVAGALAGGGTARSGLFQQAAEQGVVGVALLGAGYCWLLHALWRSPRPTAVVLTAGAALTVLAALAITGDALSHTTVTAGAGLLAGLATAHPLADEAAAGDG